MCSQNVDLVFVLDASGSIKPDGFEQVKQFTKDIVDSFEIGHDKTHVGVVTFSEFAELQIKLSDTFDREELYTRIGNLTYQGFRTATDDALRVVNREAFTLSGGARQGVAQVLIFLTDGKCTLCEDSIEDLVKPLKNRGVTIYTVGITDNINRTELEIISSDPSERHMFEVESISELKGIIFNLKERTCIGKSCCIVFIFLFFRLFYEHYKILITGVYRVIHIGISLNVILLASFSKKGKMSDSHTSISMRLAW